MCQPSDAGLTSIILKIEAPRSAADVRKPARNEWPANNARIKANALSM